MSNRDPKKGFMPPPPVASQALEDEGVPSAAPHPSVGPADDPGAVKVEAPEVILNPDGTRPPPPLPKNGIDVVANRPGVYKRRRLGEGAKFKVASMKELGDWMNLADPRAEKARRLEQDKKEKAKAGK